MPKLLQINSVVNTGSTGRIVEQLGQWAMTQGWESYIAYGREPIGADPDWLQGRRVSACHSLEVFGLSWVDVALGNP